MSTIVLLTLTGLGLGAMYFLLSAGLSLIWGLMGILNLAHGLFLVLGSYTAWWVGGKLEGSASLTVVLVISVACGLVVVGVFAPLVELILLRPLYRKDDEHKRQIDQVLVTIGLLIAGTALIQGIWGGNGRPVLTPTWMSNTTTVFGARIPNDRWVEIGVALVVFGSLDLFLRRTRYGLVIRAGVENRSMVTALGIDVRTAFTFVFAIGGILAALAGGLSNFYFSSVSPQRGVDLLLYPFVVIAIGGLGSITGSLLGAVVVGLVQQYGNYYGSGGLGEIAVMGLLFIVLLFRPQGLRGQS